MLTTLQTNMHSEARVILEKHYGKKPAKLEILKGGLTNTTYEVIDSSGERFILQQMHPIFDGRTVVDGSNVARYLETLGWEMQRLTPTTNSLPYVLQNSAEVWRLLTYIHADSMDTTVIGTSTLQSVGSLLARLHGDLGEYKYNPLASIPHFHDASYYARRLSEAIPNLPEQPLRRLAGEIIRAFETLPEFHERRQLIHGDPRTNNILFRESEPFTYIDFDTLMEGTIWMDIGDLLRALSCDGTQTEAHPSRDDIVAVAEGYYAESRSKLSMPSFLRRSIIAMQTMSLELAMRFLIDVVDDCYFGWDSDSYASRRDNNVARAQAQWTIYTISNGFLS